jgi:hypothetical protein
MLARSAAGLRVLLGRMNATGSAPTQRIPAPAPRNQHGLQKIPRVTRCRTSLRRRMSERRQNAMPAG